MSFMRPSLKQIEAPPLSTAPTGNLSNISQTNSRVSGEFTDCLIAGLCRSLAKGVDDMPHPVAVPFQINSEQGRKLRQLRYVSSNRAQFKKESNLLFKGRGCEATKRPFFLTVISTLNNKFHKRGWEAAKRPTSPLYKNKIQLTQHRSCFPDFQFQDQPLISQLLNRMSGHLSTYSLFNMFSTGDGADIVRGPDQPIDLGLVRNGIEPVWDLGWQIELIEDTYMLEWGRLMQEPNCRSPVIFLLSWKIDPDQIQVLPVEQFLYRAVILSDPVIRPLKSLRLGPEWWTENWMQLTQHKSATFWRSAVRFLSCLDASCAGDVNTVLAACQGVTNLELGATVREEHLNAIAGLDALRYLEAAFGLLLVTTFWGGFGQPLGRGPRPTSANPGLGLVGRGPTLWTGTALDRSGGFVPVCTQMQIKGRLIGGIEAAWTLVSAIHGTVEVGVMSVERKDQNASTLLLLVTLSRTHKARGPAK
ncbi:hypothetical protein B0H19DRAFT_1083597 [Mycena capillaripes]|nr:hypothetical protein B0H19DRAFT_1083597 [Mycena capillaripes]